MDMLAVILVVSLLTAVAVVVACLKWNVYRDRLDLWAITREALTTRRHAAAGLAELVIYLAASLVLGNHVHYFYGRLIFTLTASAAAVTVLSALLVGLLFTLFSYNLMMLGLTGSKKGSWGMVGTLLAVALSFCP
jgi:hypothetical protein